MMTSEPKNALTVSDVDSRLWLQTLTQDGRHWDEVVGVSQRCLNQSFAAMFDMYPDMAEMYNSQLGAGEIQAKMTAPTLLLSGTSEEVFFQLNFAEGYLADDNGKPLIEDLTGWTITSAVQIGKQTVTLKDGMSQEEKDEKLRENDWLQGFDKPGEYSAERVYAKLSSIKWTAFDADLTFCGLDNNGKPIPFAQSKWATEKWNAYMKLSAWLGGWSYEQDRLRRNILGVSFTLPPPKDARAPTFRPVFTINQRYPYRNFDAKVMDGETDSKGPATCNAWLWTEMVKLDSDVDDDAAIKRSPVNYKLAWSGNFATMPKPADPLPAIEGTFVMGRNVFIEGFLLYELRALSKAFDICHRKPSGEERTDGYTRIISNTPYYVGLDPDKPDMDDPAFRFEAKNVGDDLDKKTKYDPNRETVYRYRKVNAPETQTKYCTDETKGGMQATVRDENTIDVTWEKGGRTLTIRGYAVSTEDVLWSKPGSARDTWTNLFAWIHDKYTVDFVFYIDVCTTTGPNGNAILSVQDRGLDENTIKVVYQRNQVMINLDGHTEDFKNTLVSHFRDVVPPMVKNLAAKLKEREFVFPGTGVFDFRNPMFGEFGHLIAELKYKPIPKGQKIFGARAPKLEPRKAVEPPQRIFRGIAGKFQLAWTYDKTIVGALDEGKVILRATNPNNDFQCQFRNINILFNCGSKTSPFSNTDWEDASTTTSPPGTSGLATLRQQVSDPNPAILTSVGRLGPRVRVQVDSKGTDGLLKLLPGEWVEVELAGTFSGAGTYNIEVTEFWNEDDSSRHTGQFPITIT